MSKRQSNSRPARWARAVSTASEAIEALTSAFEDLEELRSEYEEWQDGLPDNLQNSALGEKLEAVTALDFTSALQDAQSVFEEADGIDLPRGFGND